jgi:hypothetical protein
MNETAQKIKDHLHDPEALENLYRENRRAFTDAFRDIAGDDPSGLIRFWKVRLASEASGTGTFSITDLFTVILIALVTAALVKLPAIIPGINETSFNIRAFAIIAFTGLIVYTLRQNKIKGRPLILYATVIPALLLYVCLLPYRESDSLNIAFLHVPLFMWCLFGMAYISFDFSDPGKRIGFIRFNGALLTMTGLLLITGGILTGITIGLFSAIGWNIEKTYFAYVVIPGVSVSPVLASYLISLYPDITRRIVPVLARVFTPIVLVTLVIYLISLAFSGIRILEDRNLLILFNVMVIAVMAIIVFSITELDKSKDRNIHVLFLVILALVTLVINLVALTAIITRLTYGITPNRVVVLITNFLVFFNLVLLTKELWRAFTDSGKLDSVDRTVASYLPVYLLWTILAIFVLPALFRFI